MTWAKIHPIVFSPDPAASPLKLTAKCYTPELSEPNGHTLLFVHGAGAHKEQWEPTVKQTLFQTKITTSEYTLRDVWTVDWPSHGEGGIINEAALKNRPAFCDCFSLAKRKLVEFGDVIAAFINSTHLCGCHIVVIGHSAGATGVWADSVNTELYTLETAHRGLHNRRAMISAHFYPVRGDVSDKVVAHASAPGT
ncbi:hypothetical protein C8R45DRAFT_946611 [Mycena sanguinolenta]|nr:hypothetical protein C8R45DRAFT_946611 [Mycena sanguinolenta]